MKSGLGRNSGNFNVLYRFWFIVVS